MADPMVTTGSLPQNNPMATTENPPQSDPMVTTDCPPQDNPNAYAKQLECILRQLGGFTEPIYHSEQIVRGSRKYWKVKIFLSFQGEGEGTAISFQTRHPRITPEAAFQDVLRETLYRFCKISAPLGIVNDYGLHPFRTEEDNRYHLRVTRQDQGTRCALLSELACTVENAYEQALEELDELRDQYTDLEARYQRLTHRNTSALLAQANVAASMMKAGEMSRKREKSPLGMDLVSPAPSP